MRVVRNGSGNICNELFWFGFYLRERGKSLKETKIILGLVRRMGFGKARGRQSPMRRLL